MLRERLVNPQKHNEAHKFHTASLGRKNTVDPKFKSRLKVLCNDFLRLIHGFEIN